MECPRCHQPMKAATLDAQLERTVVVDYCIPCQSFWFDEHESLRLTPASTLELFHVIGEHISPPSWAANDLAKCPRCHSHLLRTHDMQRATRFEYLRCPHGHGRFISFYSFLREKDFIRPLTPQQIVELSRTVKTVACANCGAPVDLTQGASCSHCGSPLSMLDLQQADRLVAQLREASQPQTIDPELPLKLARARQEIEKLFRAEDRNSFWQDEVETSGLVGAGLTALARWLTK